MDVAPRALAASVVSIALATAMRWALTRASNRPSSLAAAASSTGAMAA